MPLGATIGAAVIGGGAQVLSGNKAAKATTKAAETADATNRYIFDTQRADYAPYREVGASALGKLASMYGVGGTSGVSGQFVGGEGMAPGSRMPPSSVASPAGNYGGFETSPGYQFRVDEAMKAIERSAAARGSLRSGATMDALQRRVQGVASSEYENYANRLAQLAGIGQAGVAGSAAAGNNYANNSTATTMAAGNARASAYANTGNAVNQGIQNVAQAYLYNKGFGGGGGNTAPTSGWGTPGLY
jgi:hypothetical protein